MENFAHCERSKRRRDESTSRLMRCSIFLQGSMKAMISCCKVSSGIYSSNHLRLINLMIIVFLVGILIRHGSLEDTMSYSTMCTAICS